MSSSISEAVQVSTQAISPNSLKALSVVVPVTERCDSLDEIYRAHVACLKDAVSTFEFLFVLDEGFAASAQSLKELIAQGEPIRIIHLHRHFGEATVLMVGFQQIQYDAIITVPAYFQALPEGIHVVLNALEEGYDLVVTRRYPRNDPLINRLQNRIFHGLIHFFTGVQFHDMSCGLRGIRQQVVREVSLYGDLHRFLPLLAYQRGFTIVEKKVPQHPADNHRRVYAPGVYLRRVLDVMTVIFLFKFTKKPLRFFGLVGSGLFVTGFIISAILAIQKIFGLTGLAHRPILILGVVLMVLGVQVGSVGLLGEMIVFTHARKVKDYAVKAILKGKN